METMTRLLWLFALLIPTQVAALEYRNLELLYTDAPFLPAEAAGISVLTSVDAVQGYPDGSFQPKRTINRAEFLKIVLASHPDIRVSPSDATFCFPDVDKADWFAQYVCLAKKRGMVSGYPDGEFKPDRPVNYAEALKILSELYEYVAYSAPDEPWYAGYVRAAEYHETALPASIKFDRSLTRGQMARLAASFRAESEGELPLYRAMERNPDTVVRSSSSSSSMSSSESVSSSSESSSVSSSSVSSSSQAAVHEFPARSRFLLLGEQRLIASGEFAARNEPGVITSVTAKFREEPRTIKALWLVDTYGTKIAELKRDTYDPEDITWKTTTLTGGYVVPKEGQQLGLLAETKRRNNGGFAEELIEIKWISMYMAPRDGNGGAYQVIATDTSFPTHQTAQAVITSVEDIRPPVLDLATGNDVVVAELEIAGKVLSGAQLQLDVVAFTITEDVSVSVADWKLSALHTTVQLDCSISNSTVVSCLNIPAAIGLIEDTSIVLQLTVDVIVESDSDARLQINVVEPGSVDRIAGGTLGDIRWNDGTGNYRWLDLPKPMAEGALWEN